MSLKRYSAIFISILLAGFSQAQDCYRSSIASPSPFMGNNGEVFKLSDGSLWEVKYEYEYLYEYYPNVVICPSKGQLVVNGKTLSVNPVGRARAMPSQSTDVIESQIDGDFSGWEGETIFKLTNGQVWQQNKYAYIYSYKFRPKIVIFRTSSGFELSVEGMDKRVSVVRIR